MISLFVALLAIMTGCIAEDMSDCGWTSARVRVVSGASRADSDINGVTLFVFSQTEGYVGRHTAAVNEVVELGYPKKGSLSVIAIANHDDNRETVTASSTTGSMDGGVISLVEKGQHGEMPIYSSPSDLFFGTVLHPNSGKKRHETYDVEVFRIVSSMKVTINKLRDKNSDPEGNAEYSVVVRTKNRSFDFYGNTSGEEIGYKPSGEFEGNKDYFVIPSFNMISSAAGENVTVEIYKDDELVDTIAEDSDGEPLKAYNGRLLDIYIDYSGSLSVSVDLNGWGVETAWDKDFGHVNE